MRRDPQTEDVILSRKPGSWDDFFEQLKSLHLPDDFLADRDDGPPQKRDIL